MHASRFVKRRWPPATHVVHSDCVTAKNAAANHLAQPHIWCSPGVALPVGMFTSGTCEMVNMDGGSGRCTFSMFTVKTHLHIWDGRLFLTGGRSTFSWILVYMFADLGESKSGT